MSIVDEIQNETWHIMVSLYTRQRLVESLPDCETRYVLANHIVAINCLADMIVLRVARLADRRDDAKSIPTLLKKVNISTKTDEVQYSAQEFLFVAKPAVKIRHEKVAHMKTGEQSDHQIDPLPEEVFPAIEALVKFIDTIRGAEVSYKYKVGSQEPAIDLRESLQQGRMVKV